MQLTSMQMINKFMQESGQIPEVPEDTVMTDAEDRASSEMAARHDDHLATEFHSCRFQRLLQPQQLPKSSTELARASMLGYMVGE